MGGEIRGAPGSLGPNGSTRADRRLARGAATRSDIVRATVELIDGGIGRPSVRQVAGKAGVSRRLVFYYFRGVDALLLRAIEAKLADQRVLLTPLPPHGPAEVRVHAVCKKRRELFEALDPVYKSAGLLGDGGPDHGQGLPAHLEDLRHQLAVTFAPELEGHGPEEAMVLDLMDLVMSWESWRVLRTRHGMSASGAERYTASLIATVLEWAPER